MAEELKPDEIGLYKHHFSITHELETHPWFVAIAALGVFLIITYLFARAHPAAVSTAVDQPVDQSLSPIPPLPQPIVPPASAAEPPVAMHVRAKGTTFTWDKTHTGPPWYANPFGPSKIIPFGTAVSVLARGISGPDHNNGGQYAQIVWTGGTGYIATGDLV
jgi:hypothetical protein